MGEISTWLFLGGRVTRNGFEGSDDCERLFFSGSYLGYQTLFKLRFFYTAIDRTFRYRYQHNSKAQKNKKKARPISLDRYKIVACHA
jgi:hypothetical protein